MHLKIIVKNVRDLTVIICWYIITDRKIHELFMMDGRKIFVMNELIIEHPRNDILNGSH